VAFYKVIFLGLSVIGPEEETRLLGGLQKKFNLTPGKAESLLQSSYCGEKRCFERGGGEVCKSLCRNWWKSQGGRGATPQYGNYSGV